MGSCWGSTGGFDARRRRSQRGRFRPRSAAATVRPLRRHRRARSWRNGHGVPRAPRGRSRISAAIRDQGSAPAPRRGRRVHQHAPRRGAHRRAASITRTSFQSSTSDNQDGHYYVVMEYVEGCTLSLLLRRNPNRRPPRVITQILDRCARGTARGTHAHERRGASSSSSFTAIFRRRTSWWASTAPGTSPTSASPRRKRASRRPCPACAKERSPTWRPSRSSTTGRTSTGASDVFSAGAVLWNALTGLSLFRGESDAATLHNILNKKVPKPSSAGLRPPPFLDAICLRALERDPAQRYQSAQEMAEALRQAAIKNSALGSRTEITEWVNSSFQQEFAARRLAVREAARKRESAETRTDISLPALPEMTRPGTDRHGADHHHRLARRHVAFAEPSGHGPDAFATRHADPRGGGGRASSWCS